MTDPIHGRTIRWRFENGPTAGEMFEHVFKPDETVEYSMGSNRKPTRELHYEVASVTDTVFAVSYLAKTGWTLTSILDFESGKVVSVASNDSRLVVQHGTFQVVAH